MMIGFGWTIRHCVIPAVALVILSSRVGAQPDVHSTETNDGPYTRSAALQWSLFGTLAPVISGYAVATQGSERKGAFLSLTLMAGGVTVGPSLGHFYADHKTYGWVMAGLRAAVVGSFAGLALDACPGLEECSSRGRKAMTAYLLIGTGILGGLMIGDIISAPAAAEQANRRNARITLAPQVFLDGSVGFAARAVW